MSIQNSKINKSFLLVLLYHIIKFISKQICPINKNFNNDQSPNFKFKILFVKNLFDAPGFQKYSQFYLSQRLVTNLHRTISLTKCNQHPAKKNIICPLRRQRIFFEFQRIEEISVIRRRPWSYTDESRGNHPSRLIRFEVNNPLKSKQKQKATRVTTRPGPTAIINLSSPSSGEILWASQWLDANLHASPFYSLPFPRSSFFDPSFPRRVHVEIATAGWTMRAVASAPRFALLYTLLVYSRLSTSIHPVVG